MNNHKKCNHLDHKQKQIWKPWSDYLIEVDESGVLDVTGMKGTLN